MDEDDRRRVARAEVDVVDAATVDLEVVLVGAPVDPRQSGCAVAPYSSSARRAARRGAGRAGEGKTPFNGPRR